MPRRTPCPNCGEHLQVKALTDSDQRIWSKWRYCEQCDWDERGKFEVTVWGHEGNVLKFARDINQTEVDSILEQFSEDPLCTVQVEEFPQVELPAVPRQERQTL